jgi:hypothetical protein
MRTIKINDNELRVRATTPALTNYAQAFDRDLIADLVEFQSENMQKLMNSDFSGFNSQFLLRITWAMNKAEHYGESFPDFEEWVNKNEDLQITNPKFIGEIVAEAAQGFFPSRKTGGKPESEQKPRK